MSQTYVKELISKKRTAGTGIVCPAVRFCVVKKAGWCVCPT